MMLEKYWAWDYDINELGSFPKEMFRGRSTAEEVYLATDVDPVLKDLTWAKEKPKISGWYWHRDIERGHPDAVLNVYDGASGTLGCCGSRIDEFPGEWAGPLTPPTEAKL